MPVIDKARIIEAIQQTDDEWVLFAINRLLQIEEEEIPEWHKHELDKRTEKITRGEETYYDWEDVKKGLNDFD